MAGREAAQAEQRRERPGCPVFSANARSSSIAPDFSTPWPARISGRSAVRDQLGGALEVGSRVGAGGSA